ncbi:hypothetical protein [Paenibacillus pabuli]|uniref:hypothetical protein n=1 Tax=Paenibacillus pabuli TaxID=1472 RepID=UPI000782BD19|nr:hypothetical protein [Paenibacillus pabuli]MEC0129012.1 hypothetical protein [Paenibacillus pabuli]
MNERDNRSRKHEPYENPDQCNKESGIDATKPVYLTQGEINALQKALLFSSLNVKKTIPCSTRVARY